MPSLPEEVQDVLKELEPLLLAWYRQDKLGEIAIVHGGQDWQIEERPKHVRARVKRKQRREGFLEKMK